MRMAIIYLPPTLANNFGLICKDLNISKSAFARTAIQHFVDMYGLQRKGLKTEDTDSGIDDFDYSRIAESHLKYETGWRK